MKVIREVNDFEYDRKSAVTVGTFDGVHLGHRQIFEKLISISNSKGLRSVVVTFEPHPQIVLKNKTKDIRILSTLEEKLEIFRQSGIDFAFVINFTKDFSNTTAEDFYKSYLVDKIGLQELILGYDHMFGKNREGNIDTLKILSGKYGFNVDKVEEFKIHSEHISSTAIRKLIETGDVKKASGLLGRNYSLSGKVVEGKKLGREIGFPTANIELSDESKLIPSNGIYAVEVETNDKERHFGMMSIGLNPTIAADDKIKLEVNIFDFDKDIYGENIKVSFIEYLRDEKKFNSLEDLKKQIEADGDNVRGILKKNLV